VRRIPGIEVEKIDTEFIHAEHTESGATFKLGIRQSIFRPETLSQSKTLEFAPVFLELVMAALKPAQFSRIGHRTTYRAPMESTAKAGDYIKRWTRKHGLQLFAASEDERLRQKEVSEFDLRFEDEFLGLVVSLKSHKMGITAHGAALAAFGIKLPKDKHVLTLDLDHFTRAAAPSDGFRIRFRDFH
jgi:hypothetical protein